MTDYTLRISYHTSLAPEMVYVFGGFVSSPFFDCF